MGHRSRPQLNAWGPRHIHHRTPLLGHHLKTQDVSPLSLPDSPRIRACFTIEGDIVPPSHSKTSPRLCYHWNLHCTTCADKKPLETRLVPVAQVGLGYQHRSQLTISSWIGPSTRASTHPIRLDWVLDTSHTNENNDFIYRKERKRRGSTPC